MRVVVQRVLEASVSVDGVVMGQMARGLLVFLGIGRDDTRASADYLIKKIIALRVFDDANGKMNLAIGDVGGAFLVVSQFTLYGDCVKGCRPSFDKAADPTKGQILYDYFVAQLKVLGQKVSTGQFGSTMAVSLINDGPVTLILDSP